jgi:hypothetical protein
MNIPNFDIAMRTLKRFLSTMTGIVVATLFALLVVIGLFSLAGLTDPTGQVVDVSDGVAKPIEGAWVRIAWTRHIGSSNPVHNNGGTICTRVDVVRTASDGEYRMTEPGIFKRLFSGASNLAGTSDVPVYAPGYIKLEPLIKTDFTFTETVGNDGTTYRVSTPNTYIDPRYPQYAPLAKLWVQFSAQNNNRKPSAVWMVRDPGLAEHRLYAALQNWRFDSACGYLDQSESAVFYAMRREAQAENTPPELRRRLLEVAVETKHFGGPPDYSQPIEMAREEAQRRRVIELADLESAR